jgi:hypothetical protein
MTSKKKPAPKPRQTSVPKPTKSTAAHPITSKADGARKPAKKKLVKREPFQRTVKKFKAITGLPYYEEVEKMILEGNSIVKVAAYIHKKGGWASANLAWKERQLYSFKAWLVAAKPGLIPGLPPKWIDQIKKQLEDKGAWIDLYEEEAKLIKGQLARLEKAKETEKKMPLVLLPVVDKASEVLLRMLEQHRTFQVSLGLIKKKEEPSLQVPQMITNIAVQQNQEIKKKIEKIKSLPPEKRYKNYRKEIISLIHMDEENEQNNKK